MSMECQPWATSCDAMNRALEMHRLLIPEISGACGHTLEWKDQYAGGQAEGNLDEHACKMGGVAELSDLQSRTPRARRG